jgi:tRNA uridine 5-carboxymethylaminomethyl modification enzyme
MLGIEMEAKAVVLTNGTFLNGLMHCGKTQIPGGRTSEPASHGLTEQLVSLGFRSDRMKTGTPARLDARSIHFEELTRQDGDTDWHQFSYLNTVHRELKQMPCWITYTNPSTHEALRAGLADSPLFNGQIKSIGPRYCPSIETKIVTFADKEAHQIFLEPEGVDSNEYYVNGFSSSLPWQVQLAGLRTIKGLEEVVLYRPGYAIEYDFFDPTQLHHTLETKQIKNLFFAGQINGTTGYEEAAGQGLVAGINAHINVHGGTPFTMGRNESYIGVLIDDLVNKGVDEPYRMFTSRAEYRILLRQDNADERLTKRGYEIGLADRDRYDLFCQKQQACSDFIEYIQSTTIRKGSIDSWLESIGSTAMHEGCKISDLILRPQVSIKALAEVVPELKVKMENISDEIVESCEIQIKYAGYIKREQMEAAKLQRLDQIRIPDTFNFDEVQSLSTEARQKLTAIDPMTLAQASRIPGVSPSDINILLVLPGR